jgi:hypothetical protein
VSNAGWTIAHNEVIILYLDAANTLRASIDIVHICKVDPADPLSPLLPYKLKTDRREQTAQRILAALKDILITQDRFKLMRRDGNGVDDNCNMQSSFPLKLSETMKQNKYFCVAVRLYKSDMLASTLSFCGNLASRA